ncbi:hypothetical protein JG687_00013298 [Phytophthora cactorum]|uniref:Uncharacterized protein n=1 Tax=Phytophthora cactorum TaxID=29920 RepID=A0A8T1TZP1_9STRA|nr:hypothetical protein JG687_00013298 [Phytophthora cactorum]
MQTNTETSQQISSSVLNATNRNAVHEVESPNTVEELCRESPRRQLEFPKVMVAWFAEYQYRSLVPIDLPTIRTRKRLSDFRYVMIKIENIARRQQTYVDNPSLLQARQMLSAAMSELPIHDRTQRIYTRRSEHLQWSTIVNILRKKSRLQRISNHE